MIVKKRSIVFLIVFIVIVLIISSVFCWKVVREEIYGTITNRSYGKIRVDLSKFRSGHGRWPNNFEEKGLDISENTIFDHRTKAPYLYLANKNVYFYARGRKELCPVFVMLPKSYRTNFWPFGKEQNIVMFSYPKSLSLQTLYVDPKDIIELKPGQKVVEDADKKTYGRNAPQLKKPLHSK